MRIEFPFLTGVHKDFPMIFAPGSLDEQIGRIMQISLGDETVNAEIVEVLYHDNRNPTLVMDLSDDDAARVLLVRTPEEST